MNIFQTLFLTLGFSLSVFSIVESSEVYSSQSLKEGFAISGIDKESMKFGACVQAYVCEKLHEQGGSYETLNEIELRLGKDEVAGLTRAAMLECLRSVK